MTPVEAILRDKRDEIEGQKTVESLDTLKGKAEDSPPSKDFRAALVSAEISLIAEIKRRSPSRGKIADINVEDLARTYDNSPAAAVSVLTDRHFEGELSHLREAGNATSKPILRKDFILDPYQIYQAKAYGADAVLLIASFLERAELAELYGLCVDTGLHALIESHDKEDLSRIPAEAGIIGINNRNLKAEDMAIDMATTPRLLGCIPEGKTIVCESGIFTREDVRRIRSLGRINAVLVGTSIIGSGDPAAKIAELLS